MGSLIAKNAEFSKGKIIPKGVNVQVPMMRISATSYKTHTAESN